MDKKVEWTQTSIKDRFSIYQFWSEHNKSEAFSKKLETLFNEAANLIASYPELGSVTDLPGIRVKIIRNYKIFYRIQPDRIQIIRVWDSRQNPENLKFE